MKHGINSIQLLIVFTVFILASCSAPTSGEEQQMTSMAATQVIEAEIQARVAATQIIEAEIQARVAATLAAQSLEPQADLPTPLPDTALTATVSSHEGEVISVRASEGLRYYKTGQPHIYIAPDALTNDTAIRITRVEAPPPLAGSEPAGQAFDFSIDAASLRAPIEIALPLENAIEDMPAENFFVGYYEPGTGWIALPSWVSEEDNMIHTTVDHLSVFDSFLSLFPRNPVITLKQANPNPYQNVGWPPCFQDDLKVRISARDPDGEVSKVQIRLRIHTLSSIGVTDLVKFVETINGLGLTIASGGVTGVLPASETIVNLSQTKDPGIVATDWIQIFEDPNQLGSYSAALSLSMLSSCKDLFDIDATMTGTGLEKIVVDIRVVDDSGRIKDERIDIPVHSGSLPFAELYSPGPGIDDVQSPLPTFRWQVEDAYVSDYTQRLRYAKGDSLWDRWLGTNTVALDWNDQTWLPPKGLSPGRYVWGIEVSKDGSFRDETTTRSTVFHFTVPKIWTELTVEESRVKRTKVTSEKQLRSLGWIVMYNGERILDRNALNETELDLQSLTFIRSGTYTVWVESFYDNAYQRVSNQVAIIIVPTPTPRPTVTPTPPRPATKTTPRPTTISTPRSATVTPTSKSGCSKPIILEFRAVPPPQGSTARFTLRYTVQGAKSVEIFGNLLSDPQTGTFDVWDDVTNYWVLTAINTCGFSENAILVDPDSITPPGAGFNDVTVSQREITIAVRDNQSVDGDRVDVTVNGVKVLSDYTLTSSPFGVTVVLNSGQNTVSITALNEGSSSPNTVEVSVSHVTSGDSVQVSTGLRTGQTVSFNIQAP